jgi:hypothetical protein
MRLAFPPGMLPTSRTLRGNAGSTLLEALIGLGLLAVLLVTMAFLIAVGRGVTTASRRQTVALALARARLEELAGLEFASEPLAGGGFAEITDLVTDLSGPEPEVGGAGLASSPGDSLVRSQAGYADHLDAWGRWVSGGGEPAADTAYVRRWRVERRGAGASELAIFDVIVTPAVVAARAEALPEPGEALFAHPDVVRLSGVRARRAR